MMSFVKKHLILLLGIILIIVSIIYVNITGDEFEYKLNTYNTNVDLDSLSVEPDKESTGIIEVLDYSYRDKAIHIKVRGLKPGRAYVELKDKNEYFNLIIFFVHKSGVVTVEDYFGECSGSFLVNLLWLIYLVIFESAFLYWIIKKIKEDMFDYSNILAFGLFIFILFIILNQLTGLAQGSGLIQSITSLIDAFMGFAIITSPVLLLTFIAVTISNIKLIRSEGKNWRNMLGFILGLFLFFLLAASIIIEFYMDRSQIIDTHHWTGIGRFISMFINCFTYGIVTYLECILMGSIIMGIVAAKHVPKFDKDYILILGCRIAKDGSLTKLLKGRADRAVEFAKMEKDKTGKDIYFVPSGGKGDDEVMAEAAAIKNYLIAEGIPEDRILVEDKSLNTSQNLKYSKELIEKHSEGKESNIAFSTTNYHVFRSGMLAKEQGIKVEGIGAKTRSYFWINAFIREFIATLVSEKKKHMFFIFLMIVFDLLMVGVVYISNVILSMGNV